MYININEELAVNLRRLCLHVTPQELVKFEEGLHHPGPIELIDYSAISEEDRRFWLVIHQLEEYIEGCPPAQGEDDDTNTRKIARAREILEIAKGVFLFRALEQLPLIAAENPASIDVRAGWRLVYRRTPPKEAFPIDTPVMK